MKTQRFQLWCLALCVFTLLSVSGRTFYVAIDGDDAAEGIERKPLRTIQKAAEQARAGDTILVRTGVYHGHLFLRFSGESNKPMVLKNYPGDRPIFERKGRVELQSEHGWRKAIGWITIEGFEERDYRRGSAQS